MKHCKKLLSLLGVAALCTSAAFAGNGAPSGAHYNLNIIGVSNPKTADMSNSNGHVIFVALGGRDNTVRTKIILTEGDFAVTDKNGTDGTAGFQLPASNVDCAVDAPLDDPCQLSGDYAVFIRGLGKPGGQAWITTCFTDATGAEYCSTETVHVVAHETVGTGSKPAKFVNVTKELTTVCLDTDVPPDGFCDVRSQLFSDALAEYFWNYDNAGLRLAQLRFYDLP